MALTILIVSIAIQFTAAGLALLLIRKTGRNSAWILMAIALALMGVRRAIPLAGALSSDRIKIDPSAEGVALLISVLMLAGVWMIRKVFDQHTLLRLSAETQAEQQKKTNTDLSISLQKAEEAVTRQKESEEQLRFLGDNLPGVLLYQIDSGKD